MECCKVLSFCKPQRRETHVSLANLVSPNTAAKSTIQSQNFLKMFHTPKSYGTVRKKMPLFVVVANSESRSFRRKCSGVGTPLEPISPEGKFLGAILQSQPQLFEFALSGQLDELVSDRDRAIACKKQSSNAAESLLHRRIAEMKESELQIAIEDVIYMSIVHKFTEVGVPMVPKVSDYLTDNILDIWPSRGRALESIHSLEVQEMISSHLATIMHARGISSAVTTTKINRFHLGQIYALSIMYAYFLKSVCFRCQLDLGLAHSGEDNFRPLGHQTCVSAAGIDPHGSNYLAKQDEFTDRLTTSLYQENLRSYVMGFDSESLQICARLKSKEAVNVIERQTWAVFGDESIQFGKEIEVTAPSIERLVMEAAAFGSFLWDVERSVDSIYQLKQN